MAWQWPMIWRSHAQQWDGCRIDSGFSWLCCSSVLETQTVPDVHGSLCVWIMFVNGWGSDSGNVPSTSSSWRNTVQKNSINAVYVTAKLFMSISCLLWSESLCDRENLLTHVVLDEAQRQFYDYAIGYAWERGWERTYPQVWFGHTVGTQQLHLKISKLYSLVHFLFSLIHH